jgi:hypothetical protein
MQSPEPGVSITVRWWLVLLFVVLGAGAIWLGAIVADSALPWPLAGERAAYWSGVAVNIGSALVLAAILVWFERLILRKVATTTIAVVKDVAHQAAAEAVHDAAARLQPKIDELDRLIAERNSGVAEEQRTAATALSQEPSRETTFHLLREATDIRAIPITGPYGWTGTITVPAGNTKDAPRIRVDYTPEKEVLNQIDEEILVLTICEGNNPAHVEWAQGEDAVAVFAALSREMVRSGAGAAAQKLSATQFFKNLVAALEEAIKTRECRDGTWIHGSVVYELVSDDWVITDQGVEVKGYGVAMPVERLRRWGTSAVGEAPEGLDGELWKLAQGRALRQFQPNT